MRPVLFTIGDVYIGAYPAWILLAIIAGVLTLALRSRGRNVETTVLVPAFICALIAGWGVSRGVLLLNQPEAGLAVFLPSHAAPSSITYFAVGAAAAFIIYLLPRGTDALRYYDAVAPTVLAAVAIAKIGCLSAGCCAGGVCPPAMGITYPYGSPAYANQWRSGALDAPPDLVLDGERGPALIGHLQSMRLQPEVVARRLALAGMDHDAADVTRLTANAAQHRSRPVWPVPLWTAGLAGLGWLAAEYLYRRSRRPGMTAGVVLAVYGLMRLGLDWFLATRTHVFGGLALAQWLGLITLAAGILLVFYAFYSTSVPLQANSPENRPGPHLK